MKVMRENILEKAKELFLKHGVKTIGMDDIANALHISKKTIYQHFSSKDELVKITLEHFSELAFEKVNNLIGKCETPIHEHYEIEYAINDFLGKDSDSVCFFQLKKYYPELDYELYQKKYDNIKKLVSQNLTEGIKMGLYRAEIDKDFISSQFIIGCEAFHHNENFLENEKPKHSHYEFNIKFLEFYFRAIVTEKGLKILENIIKNEYQD